MTLFHNTRSIALAVAALGLAAAAQPAFAQEDGLSVKVSLADLNLNQAAGQKVAQQRIAAAANRVCGDNGPSVPLALRIVIGKCKATAIGRAQADMAAQLAESNSRIQIAAVRP